MDRVFLCATSWPLVSELLMDKALLRNSTYIHAAEDRGLNVDLIGLTEIVVHIHHCLTGTPLLYWGGSLHLFIDLDWLVSSLKIDIIWINVLSSQQVFHTSKYSVEQGVF